MRLVMFWDTMCYADAALEVTIIKLISVTSVTRHAVLLCLSIQYSDYIVISPSPSLLCRWRSVLAHLPGLVSCTRCSLSLCTRATSTAGIMSRTSRQDGRAVTPGYLAAVARTSVQLPLLSLGNTVAGTSSMICP